MTLPTNLVTGSTGHIANTNTLHGLHNLYEAITVDADTTPAELQAKIDAGPVKFMEPMTVANQQTINLNRDEIHIDLGGRELTSDADPVFSVNTNRSTVQRGAIAASAGHTLGITNFSNGAVRDVSVGQNGGKSVVHLNGGSMFDVVFEGGEWHTTVAAMSVPMINVIASGAAANVNQVRGIRMQTEGNSSAPTAPCIYLENTDANYLFGWRFEDINFEIPLAGCLHAYSVFGLRIVNCQVYDIHLGTITDDMILIENSTTGGLNSISVLVDGYFRNTGDIATPGKFDINFAGHRSAGGVIRQANGASAGNTCRITGSGYTLYDSDWVTVV